MYDSEAEESADMVGNCEETEDKENGDLRLAGETPELAKVAYTRIAGFATEGLRVRQAATIAWDPGSPGGGYKAGLGESAGSISVALYICQPFRGAWPEPPAVEQGPRRPLHGPGRRRSCCRHGQFRQ